MGRKPSASQTPARARGSAARRDRRVQLSPAQLLVGSFGGLVLFGTLGLKLLPGLYRGEPLGWLDAVFTATSAVCVTGLIVVDTATYFTVIGQAFLLLLIQLGGLGILTLTSLVILVLGRRLSLRQESAAVVGVDLAPEVDFRGLVRSVVLFTLSFEALGALVLFATWLPRLDWRSAAGHAIFHSVSAFCNAGFSTFSDSLVGYRGSPVTLLTVATLVVVGGLGFLTMEEVRLRWGSREHKRPYRFSLHSRLVLATTASLILVGWLLYLLFEWRVTLAEMPVGDRAVNGLFMSVTARTAGFNAVDYARTTEASSFLTILLMSIGGSPGSTAGGIKTTTFALLWALAWSRLRGIRVAQVSWRSIPEATVQRAVGLSVAAFALVTAAIFGLTVTELGLVAGERPGNDFLVHMFEAVSAFNTVGLSMGATGGLSVAGKWILVVLMFLGRVGPLTFAAALALRRPPGAVRYAYEEVVIG